MRRRRAAPLATCVHHGGERRPARKDNDPGPLFYTRRRRATRKTASSPRAIERRHRRVELAAPFLKRRRRSPVEARERRRRRIQGWLISSTTAQAALASEDVGPNSDGAASGGGGGAAAPGVSAGDAEDEDGSGVWANFDTCTLMESLFAFEEARISFELGHTIGVLAALLRRVQRVALVGERRLRGGGVVRAFDLLDGGPGGARPGRADGEGLGLGDLCVCDACDFVSCMARRRRPESMLPCEVLGALYALLRRGTRLPSTSINIITGVGARGAGRRPHKRARATDDRPRAPARRRRRLPREQRLP